MERNNLHQIQKDVLKIVHRKSRQQMRQTSSSLIQKQTKQSQEKMCRSHQQEVHEHTNKNMYGQNQSRSNLPKNQKKEMAREHDQNIHKHHGFYLPNQINKEVHQETKEEMWQQQKLQIWFNQLSKQKHRWIQEKLSTYLLGRTKIPQQSNQGRQQETQRLHQRTQKHQQIAQKKKPHQKDTMLQSPQNPK